MAYTNHEKIRKESGFQSEFIREDFLNSPDGGITVFFVRTDDNVKVVPYLDTGATIAGVSDVQVFVGLSGIFGSSQLLVESVDQDTGAIGLSAAVDNGASLTITYSSSAVSSQDIEMTRLQAESMINQRLSLCYSLPISPIPSMITSLATRLSSALLLIRGYGTAARDTSEDGWMLYRQLMGDGTGVINPGSDSEIANVGEVGLICSVGYQLVDDTGNLLPRDDETAVMDQEFMPGGRVRGRVYDITEEAFRRKNWQENVDRNQPGSGIGGDSTDPRVSRDIV